jgi:hypothetical protein
MADVKDLNQERVKRSKKRELKKSELYYQIIQKMNRHPLAPKAMPEFPRRYHVLSDSAKKTTVLAEGANRTVFHVCKRALAEEIARFAVERLGSFPGAADMSIKDAEACRDLWVALTPPLETQPLALAELSTPGLAFRRLPFDAPPDFDGPPPPVLREFLSRCTHADALAAFIGSLFYPESDRQQYVYLYGDGQDGKGTFLRTLFHLLGPEGAVSMAPKEKNDRFYNMRLYGKRLVIYPDCDDFAAFKSPHFKSLTGGDPLYFEPKGEPGFSAIPTCKVIAASNMLPNITGQRADIRRLIFCEVSPFPGETLEARYEEKFLFEAEQMIQYCKGVYEKLCPRHGPIPCGDGDAVTAIAEAAEEHFAIAFHRSFAVAAPDEWVRGDRVLEEVRRFGIHRGREMANLKSAWRRMFGVEVKKGSDGLMRYHGMKYEPKTEF